ncbi:MAG: hypothetical protein JST30_04810 [Armatimonadetes bacterium]|nr:hypothetical protein [Armatimonadota bacterium]
MQHKKPYRRAIRELRAWRPRAGMSSTLAAFGADTGGRRPSVRTWVATSALTAVALGAVVLVVPTRPAYGIDQVTEALKNAPNVHIVMTGPSGAMTQEMWVSGTMRRYRFQNDFKILYESTGIASTDFVIDRGFDGERVWAVNPGRKSASIAREGPVGFGWKDVPTVASIASEFGRFAKGEVLKSERTVGGRSEATYTDAKSGWKLVITTEPDRGRPLKSEFLMREKDGRWTVRSAKTYEYPESFPQETFSFRPPDGYVVYDYDTIVGAFDKNLSGAGPARTVGGVQIRILGAYREEDGTVMVVWSGGACPPPRAVAGAFDSDGKSLPVDSITEGDDRNRPKNHGVPPKTKPKPVPRDQVVDIVRPLGFRNGNPVYGLRVFMPGTTFLERGTDPKPPAVPNRAVDLTVVLPVCRKITPKVVRPAKGWIKFRVDGEQVGTATFEVTARPIDRFWRLLKLLDPAHSPSMGAVPLSKVQKP